MNIDLDHLMQSRRQKKQRTAAIPGQVALALHTHDLQLPRLRRGRRGEGKQARGPLEPRVGAVHHLLVLSAGHVEQVPYNGEHARHNLRGQCPLDEIWGGGGREARECLFASFHKVPYNQRKLVHPRGQNTIAVETMVDIPLSPGAGSFCPLGVFRDCTGRRRWRAALGPKLRESGKKVTESEHR